MSVSAALIDKPEMDLLCMLEELYPDNYFEMLLPRLLPRVYANAWENAAVYLFQDLRNQTGEGLKRLKSLQYISMHHRGMKEDLMVMRLELTKKGYDYLSQFKVYPTRPNAKYNF